MYKGHVLGRPTYIHYGFIADRFGHGSYVLDAEYTDPRLFVEDYESLKSSLEAEYGSPTVEKQNWRDNQYKSKPTKWGTAIKDGHLTMHTEWHFDDMTIKLRIEPEHRDDGTPRVSISYDSHEYAAASSARRLERIHDDL